MKYWKYYLVALLVIVIDQLSKWAVHRYMPMGMGGEIPVFGDWFKLHYTLNPGMAFGVELPEPYGKALLTLFRLVAVTGISYYIYRLWKQHAPNALMICIALILGGAIGNLVDSIFYGVIYDNAPFGASTPWLHGQVIDMLYVDIYEGILPSTWPLVGGAHLSLWPIFNIADAAIFVGVALILLFQNRFYGEHFEAAEAEERAAKEAAQARRDAEAPEVA
ncbi:lipoprotein signal peptidase [Hymenobacter lapidiphilus]|uniref:lipoprotein signal peptidase n=1 Tax=Hymenobacter sp. CCM 8763 TaxID=2303334 RepID=UPI000E349149|nr:lipoprotein signal peptidase [Hymenobacter sp. CCM 8763]RFP64205.1 lipoprotein signal peptidase [Hymenobacter sp. CCM 8763]